MTKELGLFKYKDYKAYLRLKVGEKSSRRGIKSALARHLSCQATYVSQVLYGTAHFSLEQASGINDFLAHSKDESHYFLLLVQKERAGNQSLRRYFTEQIQELIERRLSLVKRLGASNTLSEENRAKFYSSWHYLAIHIALTIPELQTKEALASYFNLPIKKVVDGLEFLLGAGLVKQSGDRYSSESMLLRIGNDSPHILNHHTNWRTQALLSLDRERIDDLHYSAVVSLSRSDVLAIKERILENIKEYVNTIRSSKEEELRVLTIDFFGIDRR